VNTARQLAQLVEQAAGVRVHLVQGLGGEVRLPADLVPCQLDLGHQRHHVLLHSVVDVALEAAALDVLGGHDPEP